MTHRVVLAQAQSDLDAILDDLLAKAGSATAAKYARAFDNCLARLSEFPRSGAPRPRLGPDTRILIITPYVVFYDCDPANNGVTVLRILHGRRNITKSLMRAPG